METIPATTRTTEISNRYYTQIYVRSYTFNKTQVSKRFPNDSNWPFCGIETISLPGDYRAGLSLL
jgi:hypothetical protein